MDETTVACKFDFEIFENDSYRICRYRYVKKPAGETRRDFVACGNDLPVLDNVIIDLHGTWGSKGRDKKFVVSYFELETPNFREGVISYLSSLKCGVGKKTAAKIFAVFGEQCWEIIENQPDQLSKAGLSSIAGCRLSNAVRASKMQAEIIHMFQGTPINYEKANRIIKKYGSEALHILQDNPYVICEIEGFSFATVDTLALGRGVDPANINRRLAAANAALNSAAIEGHVCLPRDILISKMMRLLNRNGEGMVSEQLCEAAIVYGIGSEELASTSRYVYTIARYRQEKHVAVDLFRIMEGQPASTPECDVDALIMEYERENGLVLAEEQKRAVKCVMDNQLVVLTGGPGTGKTTTMKAILYVHKAIFQDDSLAVLMSPTGKAARRMSESTGYPASTIHSGLGLTVGDEEDDRPIYPLEGNLIMVDECSMADQHVTFELLRRVQTGSKLVLIGDPDQLPSVGCGNVLAELIRSQAIPVVKLSVIFRQAQDNPIVENAQRTRHGDTDLLWSKSFSLMEMNDHDAAFKRAVNMYVQCVKKYGIDDSILLCPYRKSTALNVNRFNFAIQDILNPHRDGKLYMKGHSVFVSSEKSKPIEFRKGDPVMMTINTPFAKNGDVGYIKDIVNQADPGNPGRFETVALVEFNGDGNITTMGTSAIKHLDLAYCTTVHKSQGSEYKNVIMVMSSLHKQMLKRNLFYTGITRAKENVLLIGDREAVNTAILDVDTTRRYTLLADRLHALQVKRAACQKSA